MKKFDHILIKQARRKLGLSGRQFAKKLGISKSAYFRYERGKRRPPNKVIKKCCKILDIPFKLNRAEDGIHQHHLLINRKISLLRKLKLMSLKVLSYRSGISYHKCRRIESGEVYPTREEVKKIAHALGYNPSIFRRENFVKLLSKIKGLFVK